ncbi:putative sodium-coupled neutral amino acid transporter 10 [Anthonomus grandis grandis]|uniref:putative sodium-coupled neutral amino acid transporter 10 n=1 Tax=Anthonomus grandis grandis TaxID=2921223 RepID=UPI0021669915|nr:putative sodium-coupled neutral amino acid transporter 10 [Anthonomus grandis grandis]
MWTQEGHSGHVLTLANSIIGVSILAMPYCFKQCGILLAIIILLVTNLISRLSCHFLIKSAILARRKTFENLAYHLFGELGKFFIEVGMIGFLVGTCIAFFVVMGDLGPEIIAEITGQDTTSTMRSTILLVLALFCVLPLGLQRNVDSLVGISKATIGFYFGLVAKIIIDAIPHIFYGDWYSNVHLWRPDGVLQCLPIFSMALSCQTQLFEIYQVVHNPSLEKMNSVIKNAINICTVVYFAVGFFGYVAFADQKFTGNILLSFETSLATSFIKLGFILSVAFSFPLAILPCRASAHSLIYRQGICDGTSNDYIPDTRFKALTLIIVGISLVIGILIPNIEFVLGLVGSSIGIMICILFPVMSFIYVSKKNTNEMLLAKGILVVGLTIMILGTYENLHHLEKLNNNPVVFTPATEKHQLNLINNDISKDLKNNVIKEHLNHTKLVISNKVTDSPEIRHEPPQPVEQSDSADQTDTKDSIKNFKKPKEVKSIVLDLSNDQKIKPKEVKEVETSKTNITSRNYSIPDLQPKLELKDKILNERVDIEAIKKDDEEILLEHKGEDQAAIKDHQSILEQIQKQNAVQEEIVKQQKKLIEAIEKQQKEKAEEDKLKAEIKAVKEIESIALRAIEKISGDPKENKKIVAELEKNVQEKVIANENVREQKNNVSTSVLQEAKIDELKQMNSLLSAKIKENNVTQKPSEGKIPLESLDVNVLPNNLTANKTNMGPLLANLGQEEINVQLKPGNNRSALPLPLVVSIAKEHIANFTNVTINSGKALKLNTSDEVKKNNINIEDEIKVMRRDILSYVNTRRRRR